MPITSHLDETAGMSGVKQGSNGFQIELAGSSELILVVITDEYLRTFRRVGKNHSEAYRRIRKFKKILA